VINVSQEQNARPAKKGMEGIVPNYVRNVNQQIVRLVRKIIPNVIVVIHLTWFMVDNALVLVQIEHSQIM